MVIQKFGDDGQKQDEERLEKDKQEIYLSIENQNKKLIEDLFIQHS